MPEVAERPLRAAAPRLLVLALLASALGSVVLIDVLPRLEAPPEREGRPLLPDGLPPEARLGVRWRDKAFAIEETKAGWVLVEDGTRSPIPASRGEDFARGLSEARVLARIAGPEADLAEFGLANPRGSVRVGGNPPIEIALGASNPPLTAFYVQVLPGGEVDLVGAALRIEVETLAAMAKGGSAKASE